MKKKRKKNPSWILYHCSSTRFSTILGGPRKKDLKGKNSWRRDREHHGGDGMDGWKDGIAGWPLLLGKKYRMQLWCWWWLSRTKYIICTKLMTVKWDMQQKHGSPPRVMKKKKQLVWMKCNDPCAFYSPQHGGYKLFCACKAALPACSFKTNGCTAELDFRERNGKRVQWGEAWGYAESNKTKAQNNLYAPWQVGDVLYV